MVTPGNYKDLCVEVARCSGRPYPDREVALAISKAIRGALAEPVTVPAWIRQKVLFRVVRALTAP